MTAGRLLWIDDDGPGRFPYEERQLKKGGWEVSWAPGVYEGARSLGASAFDVLLLDQMLPWSAELRSSEEVWAGCLLFYWLRGKGRPHKMPPRDQFSHLQEMVPLSANRDLPVIVISAFFDDEIFSALHEIEPQLRDFSKPIDFKRLRQALDDLRDH